MPRKAKGCLSEPGPESTLSAPADLKHCLCLICRQGGHLVKMCPRFLQGDGLEDESPTGVLSRSSPFNLPFLSDEASAHVLCHQCSQLDDQFDILAGARPSERDQYMEKVKRRTTPIPLLGPVTSIRLLSTCPLCRLIFDITYFSSDDLQSIRSPENAEEGQLALVPAWTLVHLDPAQEVWPKKEWGSHSVCLYTAVTRAKSRWQPQIGVHAGVDAIAMECGTDKCAADVPVLGVKKVDPQTPDYNAIKEWLRRCDTLHQITCRPLVSEDLKKIKLVDVETRQIVMYPSDGCDYIALSYVWGGVVQPSYKLGDSLSTVPATLEDAMVVTRRLGKRYLWADSLCIDQGDSEEKNTQIPLMSAIYTGAWATLFNVVGQSARSGFPRVGALEGVIPQLSCRIGEKVLLSLMPSLSTQISESLWDTRAWTFQEGLLSPRRLFFTHCQVYFECNLVQCCESIDDSRSPFHLLSDETREASFRDSLHLPNALVFSDPDEEFDGGVLRDPFRPIYSSKRKGIDESFRIWKYEQLVHRYTERKMTMDVDALNAFSAILTRFQETHYNKGFVHGLPVEDLPIALLWTHDDDVGPRQRDGFPSWSWAGWEGAATGAADSCVRGTTNKLRDEEKRYLPPLRVWKTGADGRPELIYDFNPLQEAHSDPGGGDEKNEGDEGSEDTMNSDEQVSMSPQSDGGHSSQGSDSWKDVSDSDEAHSYPRSIDSDQNKSETSSSKEVLQYHEEDSNRDGCAKDDTTYSRHGENGPKRNPIVECARMMLDEAPMVPENFGRNEILMQAIILRLTFTKLGLEYQDPDDCAEWCRIKVRDRWQDNCLILYGHNRGQLATERQGKEQEFLLLRRTQFDSALMMIDREGEMVRRAGVASLVNLSAEDLLTVSEPVVEMIKLK
ncbi:heterokaryon incompatibility protein-domain-containing protein [Chiua virens]|nr:heterokaryon incompatibility protein-domain-containing protein [Chiua virens]